MPVERVDSLALELQAVVSCLVWVRETQPGLGRAERVLTTGLYLQPPISIFLVMQHKRISFKSLSVSASFPVTGLLYSFCPILMFTDYLSNLVLVIILTKLTMW